MQSDPSGQPSVGASSGEELGRLRGALRAAGVIAFEQDRQLRYTWVYSHHPSFASDRVLGRRDEEIFPQDDFSALTVAKRDALQTGAPTTCIIRAAVAGNSRLYEVEVSPIHGTSGETTGIRGIWIDVTLLRQQESALDEAQALLKLVHSSTRESTLILLNRAGCIVSWDESAEALLGYRANEILGRHLSRLYDPEAAAAGDPEHDLLLASEVGAHQGSGWRRHSDGRRILAHFALTLLPGNDPAHARFSLVLNDVTETRRAEDALRESEARLRAMNECSPVGLFFTDEAGACLYINPAAVRITGLTFEEALGAGWARSVHPEDRAMVVDKWARAAAEFKDYECEHRFLHPDGKVVWAHVRSRVIEDREATIGWLGVIEDTTARRVETDALISNAEQFRQLIHAVDDVFWVFDIDADRPIYISPAYELVWGRRPEFEQLGPEAIWETMHPEDRDRVRSTVEARRRIGYEIEYRIVRPDGSVRWIHDRATPVADTGGRVYRSVGICTDITERKLAEQAIAEREERLELAIRGSSEGIWDCDLVTKLVFTSPRAAEFVGETELPRDLEGLSRYVHHDDRARLEAAVHTHLADRLPLDIQARVLRASGDLRWVQLRGHAVWDDADRPIRVAGSIADVTERVRAERELTRYAADLEQTRASLESRSEELRQSLDALAVTKGKAEEATRAKSSFLANMSHEIRTPMNGVLGMLHLLADTPLNAEQRDCLSTARGSAESLLTILNDILDFSKIEAGKLELEEIPCDLLQICEEVLDLLAPRAQEKRLDLLLTYARTVPRAILGDPVRIRQILMNYLNNAIKFTERGSIRLRVEERASADHRTRLRFSVTDTGVGIPASRVDLLFRKFSQVDTSTSRQYGGTGLGLAICRQLAELMSGDVGVQSVEGSGTTFWAEVELLVDESALERPDSSDATNDALPLGGRRYLVLDAREAQRENLREMLNDAGAYCAEGLGPEDWLLELEKMPAGAEPDDVNAILIGSWDTGASVLSLPVRARRAGVLETTPILLLSACPPAPAEWRAAGYQGALRRPHRRRALLELLDRSADGSTARPPSEIFAVPAVLPPIGVSAGDGENRPRVLLVEDNPVNQKVAHMLLARLGADVDVAADGLAAVERAARVDYDLILMDCQMPRLDGYEATRRIREAEPPGRRVPIVAMTACAMPEDRERCLEVGMDDYLPKPIQPDHLRRIVQATARRLAA